MKKICFLLWEKVSDCYFYLCILKALHIQHVAWSDFLIFITRVDIADGIINASEHNRDCSEPVASTNLDNEVMQQDFVFEDEENNQVRNVET